MATWQVDVKFINNLNRFVRFTVAIAVLVIEGLCVTESVLEVILASTGPHRAGVVVVSEPIKFWGHYTFALSKF